MDVPVYDMNGTQTGTMPVDEIALGETVNAPLIKQAYVRYHSNRRQGSARTRGRGQLNFTTKKLYKQKGTGRARHGAKSAPIFRKGGHTFAKTRGREDYRKDMPKKMRRVANRNALLAKLIDGEVKVIDSMAMDTPKTKTIKAFFDALGMGKASVLLALGQDEKALNVGLSARNVDTVSTCRADQLNCFEMLNHRYIVVDKGELEAWLAGPSSKTGKDAKPSSSEITERRAAAKASKSKKKTEEAA